MKNTSISIFATIVIIAAIIGGYYFLKDNPSVNVKDTSNGATATATVPGDVSYKNDQYGLKVELPPSWKGYSVLVSAWSGYAFGGTGDSVVATGPMIFLRNPAWTEGKPTQDLPIVIYTLSQWNDYQAGKFHFAAPVKDSELARNTRYVFALPARYNYGEEAAKEEVEAIIASHSISAY